jgi:peptidyl-prolyl cis-trans isomerase SurA
MTFFKSCLALTIAAILIFFAPLRAPAEIFDRMVAIVNNDIITLHELNAKMRAMTGRNPADLKNEDDQKYVNTRQKVLDMLINERIASQKASELNIKITSKEVDSAIERMKRQNNITQEELLAGLKERNLTYERYRKQMEQNLERARLVNEEVNSKIVVRDEEIQAYYKAHEKRFTSPEEVHLAAIFLKQTDPENPQELMKKARDLIRKLREGSDFQEFAKKYSEGPGAKDGGDLGFFKTSQLDGILSKITKALPPGGVSEPIVRPAGIQIIKVLEKRGAGLRPLGEVRNRIYDILYQEEVNRRFLSWIKDLRQKAYIKIVF